MRRAVTLSVIAPLWLLSACSRKPVSTEAAKAPEPLAIRVALAEARVVERAIQVTGSLAADETVTVSSEVAGRIRSIHADFGQRVRKGQVLAELDPTEFSLQLERSKASLAQALARVGLRPEEAGAAPASTPAIRQLAAQLDDARFKYESAKRLVASGDVSTERFNELEKAYLARQEALNGARDELRTQWASIQALQAEVALAQKRLNDTRMIAPFDGAVSARSASPGQYMKENTAILTLVKTDPLRLRLDVPESAAGRASVGDTLTFSTDAAPGATFHAVVRELNPALDPRSRSLTAEARLVENDPRLRPGMFVQVRLVTERAVSVVVVPKAALYSVAGLTKLFVIRDGKAVETKAPPGREHDGWVEVPAEQVKPGEPVAVSDVALLVNGAPVKVTVGQAHHSAPGSPAGE
jgi:RND family efflux transporter MFP subunit